MLLPYNISIKKGDKMSGRGDIIAGILILLFVMMIGYFFWVGAFALINIVFGTTLNIWWGGLLGVLVATVISNIFK